MEYFDSKYLIGSIKNQLADEDNLIANLSNIASMIFYSLEDINWAGFYMVHDDTLILGPFQGKPACIRIPSGKGVCGEAFASKRCIVVDNTHIHENHIVCDSDSKSEIVVPILKNDDVYMVLDIDSPVYDRFKSKEIQEKIVRIARLVEEFLK